MTANKLLYWEGRFELEGWHSQSHRVWVLCDTTMKKSMPWNGMSETACGIVVGKEVCNPIQASGGLMLA